MSRISKWVVIAGMLMLSLSLAAAQGSSTKRNDSAPADQATLDKLDVVHGRQDISVEITASTAVTPKVTTLTEPDRLVLDFPNTVPGTETRRIAVDREGVKSVRMGVNSEVPPTTRVVIDLEQARDYQLVPQANRLIVKFRNVPATVAETKPAPAVVPAATRPTEMPAVKNASTAKPAPAADTKTIASLSPSTVPVPAPATSTNSSPSTMTPNASPKSEPTKIAFHTEPAPASSPAPQSQPAPVKPAATPAPAPVPSAPAPVAQASQPATSSSSSQPSTTKNAAPQPTTMASAQPAPAPADPPANVPNAGKDEKPNTAPEMKKADYDPTTYIIGEQDVLGIDVWKEKDISQTVVVRPDGKITIPLVDEVYVVGMTPLQLQSMLEDKLKPFLTVPQVTVIVKEISSRKVYLMGQVGRTGPFLINSTTTVLQLIAQAGGLRDFAKKKKIDIMRTVNGKTEHYRFNYDEVIKGKNLQQNIVLRPGDTIVVP